MVRSDSSVLVVGACTTGLMMASELARYGVRVRIIDKSPGIDPHCRATFLHARTQEIFHTLGIAHPLIDSGQPEHGVRLYVNGKCVGRTDWEGNDIDSPFPCVVGLSQAKTEKALEQHLGSFGVTVERNTELFSLEAGPEAVSAMLRTVDGGEERVHAPWLIGCDGSRSIVRRLLGETFPGADDPYPYMLGDVVHDGTLPRDLTHIFLSDRGDLFVFSHDEDRHLICANVEPDRDLSTPPILEELEAIVKERGAPELHLADPGWLTYFHIGYRLAPHYRSGRVFLAGDAAHIQSLIGGHGMNSGIQDAHNLAWKLALVIKGVACPEILDTYELERRHVAENNLRTNREVTENLELFAGLSAQERESFLAHMLIPEGVKRQVYRAKEEVDLDYSHSPICREPDEQFSGGPRAGLRVPDAGPLYIAERETSLLRLLAIPGHVMLLFAGLENSGDLGNLMEAASNASEANRHWIQTFIITEQKLEIAPEPGITSIQDPLQIMHQRFGANRAKLYLIRPDGYVAYRSNRIGSLSEYVELVIGNRDRNESLRPRIPG